jgi:hypothetical protein
MAVSFRFNVELAGGSVHRDCVQLAPFGENPQNAVERFVLFLRQNAEELSVILVGK